MKDNDFEDEIQLPVVGKRFLDTRNDISFTVVGHHDNGPQHVIVEFDDGRCCRPGQFGSPYDDLFPSERSSAFLRLQRAGVDDGRDDTRFLPIGDGPCLQRSRELCSTKGHSWSTLPDEIWPNKKGHPRNARRLYRRLAKCDRCGLSGETLNECFNDNLPWYCGICHDIFPDDDLVSLPADYLVQNVCSDCTSEIM